MKMQCCVPFCRNISDNISTSEEEGKGISFHSFPSEVHLRAAWNRALGKQDSSLTDSAVVCSQHFLHDDIYETKSGLKQIVTGAIPSTVHVCMICLDTDSKLILISKLKLKEAYKKLTGHPLYDQGNLKQTLCVQCAQRLINFSRFRDKSLRARALMMDLVDKHELILRRHIKMINRSNHQLKSSMVLTMLGPDHCDLHILEHPSEDKQTELEEIEPRDVVKTEESDDSMSVDGDMEVKHEHNNVKDSVWDPLKYESITFQCTHCLEEFVHEHAYIQHMCVHLENGEGDGGCDTSQVCKPHTAVSSSSSHSSLITENKQADPGPCAQAAQTTVALLPASHVTNIEINVPPTEAVITNVSCQYKGVTDCFVKLYDIFDKTVVRDVSLMKSQRDAMSFDSLNTVSEDFSHQATSQNEVPTTEYIEPVTNSSTSNSVKVIVLKPLHCNAACSSRISSHAEKLSFICEICQKMFKQKSLLLTHIRTHTEVSTESQHQSHLTDHMGLTHIRSQTEVSTEFQHQSHLTDHTDTHTGENKLVKHVDKTYNCKVCNSKYAYNSQLLLCIKNHVRTQTDERPFTCEICKSKFPFNINLVAHMRIHSGVKSYTCELCKYKCKNKSDFVSHMRTHNGVNPYGCGMCDYRFAHVSNLVRHMKTHSGVKPYACELCEYKSASVNNLVGHMRTHAGKKPFTCEICNSKFRFNSNLASHLKTHSGENLHVSLVQVIHTA